MNTTFTAEDLCKCARREVSLRRRVYRRLVNEDKMSQQNADLEIALMVAIAEHFENLVNPKLL